MPAPTASIDITLSRTGIPEAFQAFVSNPLTVVATFAEDTASTFDGSLTVRCEIHVNRNVTDEAPLAAITLTEQTGDTATFAFTAAQMNQPLEGASRRAFWLVIYATYADADVGLKVFQLGTLTLLAHPAAAVTPPPPFIDTFLTEVETMELIEPLQESVADLQARLADVEEDNNSFVSGGVILRRDGMPDSYINPLELSDAGRGQALITALVQAQLTPEAAATITLVDGGFAIPAGEPMSSFSTVGNVTVVFGDNAKILYTNPEDACGDSEFFAGYVRYAVNFGQTSNDSVDNTPFIQAALNSMRLNVGVPYETASGRKIRSGTLFCSSGNIGIGSPLKISPCITFSGVDPNSTRLMILNGSANTGDEQIFLDVEEPEEGIALNNLFNSTLRDFSIFSEANNSKATAIKMQGGQGTLIENVTVADVGARGIIMGGGRMQNVWVGNVARGPGVDWTIGGYFDFLSVEHVNPTGITDPATGEPYPAISFDSGPYTGTHLQGEQNAASTGDIFARVKNATIFSVDNITFGPVAGTPTNTVLRLFGTSMQHVRVRNIQGISQGYFAVDPGTLVNDSSNLSPAGSGVSWTVDGLRTDYDNDERYADLTESNTLTGANVFSMAPDASGLVTRSTGAATGERFGTWEVQYNNTPAFRAGGYVVGPGSLAWTVQDGTGSNLFAVYPDGQAMVTGNLTAGGNAVFGNTTLAATATPLYVDMGGTYGNNTAGSPANLKFRTLNFGSGIWGIGASAGKQEYQTGAAAGHYFYTAGAETMRLTDTGNLTVAGTIAGSAILLPSAPPANASSAGVAGTITYASGFIYVCVATDTWQRAALASW